MLIPDNICNSISEEVIVPITKGQFDEINFDEVVKPILEGLVSQVAQLANNGMKAFNEYLKNVSVCPRFGHNWVSKIQKVVNMFKALGKMVKTGDQILRKLNRPEFDCNTFTIIASLDVNMDLFVSVGKQDAVYITFKKGNGNKIEVSEIGTVKAVSTTMSMLGNPADAGMGKSLSVSILMGDKGVWGEFGYTIALDGSIPVKGVGVGVSGGLVFTANKDTYEMGKFIGIITSFSLEVGTSSVKVDADVSISCGYAVAKQIEGKSKETTAGTCKNVGNDVKKNFEDLKKSAENIVATVENKFDELRRCGGLYTCQAQQCAYNWDGKHFSGCEDMGENCADEVGGCLKWEVKCQRM